MSYFSWMKELQKLHRIVDSHSGLGVIQKGRREFGVLSFWKNASSN